MARTKPFINPSEFFESWLFIIDECYWSMLGFCWVSRLDQTKNVPLREERVKKLITEGIELKQAKKQATQEYQIKKHGWAPCKPNINLINEGYIFSSKTGEIKIQITTQQENQISFAIFDNKLNKYIDLRTTNLNGFLNVLETGLIQSTKKIDPTTLPESGMKYELKRTIN